jgi:GNAT superfamily N-acetyltransferase
MSMAPARYRSPMAGEIRVLGAGDEALLFSFLEARLESSIFLVSNAERGGLVDRGEPLQATYAAHVVGGVITAVAAHGWNGNVLVQGDVGVEDAARAAVAATMAVGRNVRGIIGPRVLVQRTRTALDLDGAPVARALDDRLFVLELAKLRVPAVLEDRRLEFRAPTAAEVAEPLAGWRAAYHEEVLGTSLTPELVKQAFDEVSGWRHRNACWVLARDGVPVSFTGFNASARGVVQVGGVYTPPALRRNGYGRAAVAGSLLLARSEGATRSTLFTAVDNDGAVRAYTTLGYEAVSDFGLLLFR